MQCAVTVNSKDYVSFTGERLVTDSVTVAKAFGKYHYHVIAKLKKLECSAQFLTHNFTWVKNSHNGNEYEMCEMTKDRNYVAAAQVL